MTLQTVETALAHFRAGKMIIIVDDEERENEGDLAIAAECVTPEAINFMATQGRGLICVALAPALVDRLQLPLMVPPAENRSGFGTNFTVSVEARDGVTTGISAYDRARTVAVLVDPTSRPEDIVMPGHIFPLRARVGGVLERRGQTEAGVDLARLAGLAPAAVICEVMASDGTMARGKELTEFAAQHGFPIVSVAALARYRRHQEGNGEPNTDDHRTATIASVATAGLPTGYGNFCLTVYRDEQQQEHVVLRAEPPPAATQESTVRNGAARNGKQSGEYAPLNRVPLVRLHSECATGDILGSLRCDCGDQLQTAMARIGQEGGLLLYLRQEGRGIGLANKIRAYALQDEGLDTVEANVALGFPADSRDYSVAAAMLRKQGVEAVRLLTNNPHKVSALQQQGIKVVERVPLEVGVRAENVDYLRTKAEKLKHFLTISDKEIHRG
jgi:3,4-dihydroxy 2-butanone 4-phosphate synthase / GTP cyclohydrolase II